jgi:hypothetical protein
MRSYSRRGVSIVPNVRSFDIDLSVAVFVQQVVDALERRCALLLLGERVAAAAADQPRLVPAPLAATAQSRYEPTTNAATRRKGRGEARGRRRLVSLHRVIDDEPHSRNACPEPATNMSG